MNVPVISRRREAQRLTIERQHPSERDEFVDGIHRCQNQLAWRIVQRTYPKAWPIKR